jgi:CubicO group peptidase (beta-lactamase class C family)
MDEQRAARLNEIGTVLLLSLRRGSLAAVCVLAAVVVGCSSPSPTGLNSIGSGASSAEPSVPSAPRFAAGGPDSEDYGASDGYPIGDRSSFFQIPFLVGSHSHLDQIFESRLIRRATTPSRLARVRSEPALRYEFEGETRTLDDYLARNPATGLLVARGDTILVERYQYGRTDRHRFTSWSMAKTVTSMLVGIAIAEGRIRSVDDTAAAYVPALEGAEYGLTSLRHLLQMSSGVRFMETYSGNDDVSMLAADTFFQWGAGGVKAVTQCNDRTVPSGTRFSYSSAETQVLGLVLRSAVGRPVADYMQEKIWAPIGAEADATWLIDRSGQEVTFCCINAVLREYARLGLLLAHDGKWRGRQIIPAAWINDATRVTPNEAHLRPGIATGFFGYGYQVWTFPGERRMFAFLGVRGQAIFVDPASRLVMVHTAVRKRPVDAGGRETVALWQSLVRQLVASETDGVERPSKRFVKGRG